MNTKIIHVNICILSAVLAIGTAFLVSDVSYSSLAAVVAVVLGLLCHKILNHRQQDERDLAKKASLLEEEEIFS